MGVLNSAGAVVTDRAGALSAYGQLMKCVSDASGIIRRSRWLRASAAVMAAVAAGLFDFTVTVKDRSELFVNPPFNVGGEDGDYGVCGTNGLSTLTAESQDAAVAAVRTLVGLLPATMRTVRTRILPMRRIAPSALPAERVPRWSRSLPMRVALPSCTPPAGEGADGRTLPHGRGMTVGVVAGNGAADEGRLTAAGAAKAARL